VIKLEMLDRVGTNLILKTVYINPTSIVRIEEDHLMMQSLKCENSSKKFPVGLDKRHTLSRLKYACGGTFESITVVGAPEHIHSKVLNTKKVLRG